MKARNIWGDFWFKIKRLKNATYNDLMGCGLMRLKIQKKKKLISCFQLWSAFFVQKDGKRDERIFSLVVKFSKGVTNAHY